MRLTHHPRFLVCWRLSDGRGIPLGMQHPSLTSEVRNAFKCAQHVGELALALDTLTGEVLI